MKSHPTNISTTILPGSSHRIESLDVLRGAAVLGIYWINIVIFGLPTGAYSVPSYIGDSVTANISIWAFSEIMVDGAMRGLFSCLFGASALLYLSDQKLQAGGVQRVDFYYRRNIVLVLIGIVHGYILLWPYDILYAYGLLGLLLFPLRNLSARTLIIAGGLLLICSDITFIDTAEIESKIDTPTSQTIPTQKNQTDADKTLFKSILADEYRQSSSSGFEEDIEMHKSPYLELFKFKMSSTIEQHTMYMYSAHIFDIGGMMLLGMALLKLGVLQGYRSTRFYFRLVVAGFVIGILLRAPGVYIEINNDFLPGDPVHPDSVSLGLSRLPIMLGYIGLILLIYKLNILNRLFNALAAVGKLALTNYIMQTVISVFLFYGVGFGLIGSFDRYQLVLICILIWLVQTFFSLHWLKYYRMGPLEWLWRSAIYMQWQQNKIQNKPGADTQPIN